jgi:hypothetical protein
VLSPKWAAQYRIWVFVAFCTGLRRNDKCLSKKSGVLELAGPKDIQQSVETDSGLRRQTHVPEGAVRRGPKEGEGCEIEIAAVRDLRRGTSGVANDRGKISKVSKIPKNCDPFSNVQAGGRIHASVDSNYPELHSSRLPEMIVSNMRGQSNA